MQRLALVPMVSLGLLIAACPGIDAGTGTESADNPTSLDLPLSTSDSGPDGDVHPTTGGADPSGDTADVSTGGYVCDEYDPPPLEPIIPRVMLVLDKSGSMLSEWDHDGDPGSDPITRWMSLHAVVESIVVGLDDLINFGAVLFPSPAASGSFSAAACLVDPEPQVSIGPQTGATILAVLPPADTLEIAGGTPAAAGVQVALTELKSLQDDEPKLLVLVTDGAANCAAGTDVPALFNQYDDDLPAIVAEARSMGFPTHVIGIDIQDVTSPVVVDGHPDDTNPFEKLNELAELGGTARPGAEKFYNASNEHELQDALEKITKQALSCQLSLGEPLPDDYYILTVRVGGPGDPEPEVYDEKQVADCAAEAGWQYTGDTREAIVLCGAACEHYKQTGVVEIDYACVVP